MRFGSLFAGIGGIDLGLERAGMECAWQVEIDDFCNRVLEKHWPHVKRYRDIREVGATNLEPVDLLCGGFPCQPHSLAGKRQASADERDLWPEYARLIRELRPRWVLAENVPGLLSSEIGRFFGGILRDLAESGYDAVWEVLPAAAVGAPHIRERIWIVANADDRCGERTKQTVCPGWVELMHGSQILADSSIARSRGLPIQQWGSRQESVDANRSGEDMADPDGQRREEFDQSAEPGQPAHIPSSSDWWATEPDVGRVAHGVPSRVDRLRALGNAVVPQVAEWIGRRIMEAVSQEKEER